ncbi:conserved hypothetical protein [Paraburkholderia tropica]|uniref:DUF2486 family protein n=1 Tax=Paraburkholderia tropica TaxID=92647 RepID=UPI001CB3A4C2|nr:DUF2486 family protein [Paraburkholderia tropica]CAG9229376.1 conserved hypothetical protein [Paraburkholderia tropica]
MPDLHDVEEAPIPMLDEVLVNGNLLRARSPFEHVAAPQADAPHAAVHADEAAHADHRVAPGPVEHDDLPELVDRFEPHMSFVPPEPALPAGVAAFAAAHAAHAASEPQFSAPPSAQPAVPSSAAYEPEGLFAHDADALVERLRGRALSWLTGEGRGVIEARCSAAMQEHAHWIVGQVSREIGLALETELKGWVKAAVREELAARAGHTGSHEV